MYVNRFFIRRFFYLPGVKEDGGEESIELVRPFRMQERYHSADVVQALHLRAERRLLVKVTVDEVAVLFRGDPTHPVNPDAARVADYLANHVLCHLILVTADGEVAVAPLIPIFTVKNFFVRLSSPFIYSLQTNCLSLKGILLLLMG